MRTRHRIHGNPFNVRHVIEAQPPWQDIYGRDAPLALDIGFGAGSFLLSLAKSKPDWDILGLEIRQHLVDNTMATAFEQGVKNLFALKANANLHLGDLLPDQSVIFVSVNFPDPWFKKRHHKRRVINEAWLDTLLPKLIPDATIHVMTDFEPIGLEASLLFEAEPRLRRMHEETFATASTTGVQSEREQTHMRREEPIYRLAYKHQEAGNNDNI